MWKIYIARHGQDEDNFNWILNWHRDMPLTDIWVFQARELSKKIRENWITFDKVFSSPLKRAYHTWLEVTKEFGLENPEILEFLIERDFWIMTWKKSLWYRKIVFSWNNKSRKNNIFFKSRMMRRFS